MSEKNIVRKQVTKEGLKKLEERLAELTGVRRAEVAEKLNIARGYGDLSENAEYDAAKNEQAILEAEIVELDALIRNVEVVENLNINTDEVGVGSRVDVHFVEDDYDDTFVVVGALESDPLNNRISVECPVGAALLKAKVGDTVTVEPPSGEIYHILVKEIGLDKE